MLFGGIILGPSWNHTGTILGSSWDHVGIILGPSGEHVGAILRPLWYFVSKTHENHKQIKRRQNLPSKDI